MPNSAIERDGYLDLRLVIALLWQRRWIVAGFILVFAAAFASAALVMSPVYRARALVVSASADRVGRGAAGSALAQLGGLASIAGLTVGNGASDVEEALAVVRSRGFTERFMRKERMLSELFHARWDSARSRWKKDDDPPTWGEAYRFFDSKVRSVTFDKKSGLITVQIEWRDPVLAANWANRLVDLANAEMRERAITRSSASVEFLEQEAARTTAVDTRAAINRLLESQINQRMLANVTQEYSFRVVDRAVPPDRKDVVRPRKLLMIALGPLIGLLFGVMAVVIWPCSLLRR